MDIRYLFCPILFINIQLWFEEKSKDYCRLHSSSFYTSEKGGNGSFILFSARSSSSWVVKQLAFFFFFGELNILKAQTWVNTHYLKRDTFLLLHILITEYLHHKLTSVALIHFICPSDSVKSLKLQLSCGNYNLSSAGSLKLGIMMLSIKFRAPFAFRISML